MAYFAKINENNEVVIVVAVNNAVLLDENQTEKSEKGIDFLKKLYNDNNAKWVQTSYNKKFRKKYAAVGDYYDEIEDVFIPKKTFESWVFNKENWYWEPPVPMPLTTIDFPKDKNNNSINNLILEENTWKIIEVLSDENRLFDQYDWNENLKKWDFVGAFRWNEEKQKKFLEINNTYFTNS